MKLRNFLLAIMALMALAAMLVVVAPLIATGTGQAMQTAAIMTAATERLADLVKVTHAG